jgi:5-(carboxyamino)imidazole ribonucleotide mutase
VQILATHQPELLQKVQAYRQSLCDMVMEKQIKLDQLGYEQYLQEKPESLKAPEKQEQSSVFRASDRG